MSSLRKQIVVVVRGGWYLFQYHQSCLCPDSIDTFCAFREGDLLQPDTFLFTCVFWVIPVWYLCFVCIIEENK